MENREVVTHAYLSVSCVGQLKLTVRLRIVPIPQPFKLCDIDVCW